MEDRYIDRCPISFSLAVLFVSLMSGDLNEAVLFMGGIYHELVQWKKRTRVMWVWGLGADQSVLGETCLPGNASSNTSERLLACSFPNRQKCGPLLLLILKFPITLSLFSCWKIFTCSQFNFPSFLAPGGCCISAFLPNNYQQNYFHQ